MSGNPLLELLFERPALAELLLEAFGVTVLLFVSLETFEAVELSFSAELFAEELLPASLLVEELLLLSLSTLESPLSVEVLSLTAEFSVLELKLLLAELELLLSVEILLLTAELELLLAEFEALGLETLSLTVDELLLIELEFEPLVFELVGVEELESAVEPVEVELLGVVVLELVIEELVLLFVFPAGVDEELFDGVELELLLVELEPAADVDEELPLLAFEGSANKLLTNVCVHSVGLSANSVG